METTDIGIVFHRSNGESSQDQRSNIRPEERKSWQDLHWRLERRVTLLSEKVNGLDTAMTILTTSVHQIFETQGNNHRDSMAALSLRDKEFTRVFTWLNTHDKECKERIHKDIRDSHVKAIGWMFIMALLIWIVIKVASL